MYKNVDEYGNIIEIKILKITQTKNNPDGISYSLVYIKDGKRIIGYDNFEGHKFNGKCHHKHITIK